MTGASNPLTTSSPRMTGFPNPLATTPSRIIGMSNPFSTPPSPSRVHMSDSETDQPFTDHGEFHPATITIKTHLDLPAPNRSRAPTTFNGTPGTLETFLETYGYLCQHYEITSSRERYQGLIRYCSPAVAKLLRGLPSHRKRSYQTLLKEVKYFFGDRSECLNLGKLEKFTKKARQKKMKTMGQFQRYQLRFHQMVGPALEKKKISTVEVNRFFWEGLDEGFRGRVEARMLATNPDLDVSVPFSIDDVRQGADYILNPNRFDQHLSVKDGYESSDSESDLDDLLKASKYSGYSSGDESDDDIKPLIQRKLPLTPPKTPPRGKKSKAREERELDKLVEGMNKVKTSEPTYWVMYCNFVQKFPELKDLVEHPVLQNPSKHNNTSQEPFQRGLPPHQAPTYQPRKPFISPPSQSANPPFNQNPNQPSQQSFRPPQQPFVTGANTTRQGQPCFGCGRPGHHIRQCEEIEQLIQKRQVIRNPVSGMLQWPNGTRVFRSGNETMVQAITHNVAEVHYVGLASYEPSLDTVQNYIGVDNEDSDTSMDDQEESDWTPRKVRHCQAYAADRRKAFSRIQRENAQPVSPNRPQGLKKLPRSGKSQGLDRQGTPIYQDSDRTQNPRKVTPPNPSWSIVKGEPTNKPAPMKVDKESPKDIAKRSRKESACKGKPSIPTNPNLGPEKGKDGPKISADIMKSSVTLSIQELVQNSPSVRQGLVRAMKPQHKVSSPTQGKAGFVSEVLEDQDLELSNQEISDPGELTDEEDSDLTDRRVPEPQISQSSGGLIKVPVKVGLAEMAGVFDSGSQLDIISQDLAEKTGLSWLTGEEHQLQLISVDGKVTRCTGMVPRAKMIITTDNGPVITRGNLYVKPQAGFQLLLGRKWGRKYRAHLIEDKDRSRVEFQTKDGWHNITPLPTGYRIQDDEDNDRRCMNQRFRAKVYATKEKANEEEGEAPEIDQEEAKGTHAGEEDLDLNWNPSMPEEERSIDSDLQEMYIQMVQQGRTDKEWNNFYQQHKQQSQETTWVQQKECLQEVYACDIGQVLDEWTDHSGDDDEEDENADLGSESNPSSSDEAETLQPIHPTETAQSMSPSNSWSINNLPNFSLHILNTLLVVFYLHLSLAQLLSTPTSISTLVFYMSLLSLFQLHASTITYNHLYSPPSTQTNHPKHTPSEGVQTVSRLSTNHIQSVTNLFYHHYHHHYTTYLSQPFHDPNLIPHQHHLPQRNQPAANLITHPISLSLQPFFSVFSFMAAYFPIHSLTSFGNIILYFTHMSVIFYHLPFLLHNLLLLLSLLVHTSICWLYPFPHTHPPSNPPLFSTGQPVPQYNPSLKQHSITSKSSPRLYSPLKSPPLSPNNVPQYELKSSL